MVLTHKGAALNAQPAARIPAITRAEARDLETAELARFIALVETLGPEDWDQPTDCTLWRVRDIVAHKAGSYAAFASLAELRRQLSQRPQPGQPPEDVVNAIQVADRAGRTPAELLAELRATGRRSIANRNRWPPPGLRWLGIRHPARFITISYLFDLIYARDTWMHRADICRATGRQMVLTPEHDGRIVALVVRDLDQGLRRHLKGAAVTYALTGPAGGTWQLGRGEPAAAIELDTVEFCRLASGRQTPAEAEAQARITGDLALARTAMAATSVLF